MSKNPPVRRPSRRTNTAAGRVLSAALATTTCVGLVGVIGVRMAEENAAQAASGSPEPAASEVVGAADATIELVSSTSPAATSSDGRTREQLDAYATQLEQERQRLVDYRNQLVDIATQLQAAASGGASVQAAATLTAKSVGAPAAKAKGKPKAKASSKATTKAKGQAASTTPVADTAAAAAQPAPAQPAPQAKPAPQAQPAPQAAPPAAKPRPQAQTKSS